MIQNIYSPTTASEYTTLVFLILPKDIYRVDTDVSIYIGNLVDSTVSE